MCKWLVKGNVTSETSFNSKYLIYQAKSQRFEANKASETQAFLTESKVSQLTHVYYTAIFKFAEISQF